MNTDILFGESASDEMAILVFIWFIQIFKNVCVYVCVWEGPQHLDRQWNVQQFLDVKQLIMSIHDLM